MINKGKNLVDLYSIIEHKHRFAAWASGRAANVKNHRFTVEQGKKIIEESGLNQIATSIDNLPEPEEFDEVHCRLRELVIQASANILNKHFTHGVAAKLINVYLKSIFVCGYQYDNQKVKAIHPPIDSVLLDALHNEDVGELKKDWQVLRKRRWSNFNSDEYESAIYAIKKVLPKEAGLWQIEYYWRGFQ
jgi:hypothetical protein